MALTKYLNLFSVLTLFFSLSNKPSKDKKVNIKIPSIWKLLKYVESEMSTIDNPKLKQPRNKLALKCDRPELIKTWWMWLLSGEKRPFLFMNRIPITLRVSNKGTNKSKYCYHIIQTHTHIHNMIYICVHAELISGDSFLVTDHSFAMVGYVLTESAPHLLVFWIVCYCILSFSLILL